jgi:hypothetical protein
MDRTDSWNHTPCICIYKPTTHETELLQELQESDALLLADDAACERALDLAG